MNLSKPIAIVTGANKGLGFQTAKELGKKGYHVIVAARNKERGSAAAETLHTTGSSAEFMELDTSDEKSIDYFCSKVREKFPKIEVLVNNAGVFPDDREQDGASVFATSSELILEAFQTNTLGPLLLSQKLIPLMRANGKGRVVNVSSGMGQLSEMNGSCPAYRLSKTALNAVTRIFADETEGQNILVNSVCPGWVKTDMGGPGAERSVEKGAETIVWLATLDDKGPTGGFFRDRERIEW